MKNTIKILGVLTTIFLLSSFTQKNTTNFIGTYSVSESDPSQIKLTINADHTFYYQDFSISDKKIMINGIWKLKGKKVILVDNNSDKKFHDTWIFDSNGKVAKSHKGFTFYRLIKKD